MDEFGTFLFEYRHDGSAWALEIKAQDLDDAKARLRTLPFAKYQGKIAARIPFHQAPTPANTQA